MTTFESHCCGNCAAFMTREGGERMSDTWADAQFDMLEAAYDEVPILAKKRIAELERENAKLWRMNENIGSELANFGEQRDKAVAELTVERDAYFEMVKRVQADCDACDELIRDLWSGFECGVAKVCNACPTDAKLGYAPCAIEQRMRRLGIEVDE